MVVSLSWSNGTVEVVNKQILTTCRALITELRLAPQDCTEVLRIVQTVLNKTPLPRLGKRKDVTSCCPLKIMTGIIPRQALVVGAEFAPESSRQLSLERVKAIQIVGIKMLRFS